MATFIQTDGTMKEITPKNGTDFSLEELHKYTGGTIDIISLHNGNIMVINDNGKFECEANEKATEIAHDHGAIYFGDYIAGDVVICQDGEVL